jgi:hypothetical protein
MVISPEALIQYGFVPKVYPDQGTETFYLKTLKARDMPHFLVNFVDGERVSEDDDIVVEVVPDGTMQWVSQNPDSDQFEDGIPLDSEKGRALLRDAGFPA